MQQDSPHLLMMCPSGRRVKENVAGEREGVKHQYACHMEVAPGVLFFCNNFCCKVIDNHVII